MKIFRMKWKMKQLKLCGTIENETAMNLKVFLLNGVPLAKNQFAK